tara:strand:- start:190 stop:492 length:303 start_codon:yes stop_codon:yes gene_type:complete
MSNTLSIYDIIEQYGKDTDSDDFSDRRPFYFSGEKPTNTELKEYLDKSLPKVGPPLTKEELKEYKQLLINKIKKKKKTKKASGGIVKKMYSTPTRKAKYK